MAYQTTKPAPSDDLDVSVTDIQQNFLTANTVMDINHYPFDNLTANKGKHKFVDMPVTTLPTIASGDGGVYTKASGQTQLFYTSDAGAQEYQLTRAIDASIATFGTATGWTFLPGGILMQWGFVVSVSNSGTVTFPVTFSTGVFSISTTPTVNSSTSHALAYCVDNTTLTTSTFKWFVANSVSSSSTGFYWMAIGK